MDIKLFKNQAYVTYQKNLKNRDCPYQVHLYGLKGEMIDKVMCDNYKTARDYFKSFCKIAKNF